MCNNVLSGIFNYKNQMLILYPSILHISVGDYIKKCTMPGRVGFPLFHLFIQLCLIEAK